MCLNYVQSKAEVEERTSKNLRKPFYAWKVVFHSDLTPPWRGKTTKYVSGAVIKRSRMSRGHMLSNEWYSTTYECGIHLCFTRKAAREFKNMLYCSEPLTIVRVIVRPSAVVAWGVELGHTVVVVDSCKVV